MLDSWNGATWACQSSTETRLLSRKVFYGHVLEGSIRVQFESTRVGMTPGIVLRICLGVGYFMDSAFRADERIYDEDFSIDLRDHSGDRCGDGMVLGV